jgi:uncharacterized membrane protein YhiD involved in acid resistance
MDDKIIDAVSGVFSFSPYEIVFNSLIAFILGLVIAYVYKKTHKGLSYSQSFVLTIVFVTIIVSFVMMVIGNSIARAFALVGALSIIRFRTVVKDTKDTAFIFMALTVGMGAGTGSYFVASFATVFMSLIAYILYKFNFGVQNSSDFILRFFYDKTSASSENYSKFISQFSLRYSLLHSEPSGDGDKLNLTYDISLKEEVEMNQFLLDFSKIEGISEVVLINSSNDIDY